MPREVSPVTLCLRDTGAQLESRKCVQKHQIKSWLYHLEKSLSLSRSHAFIYKAEKLIRHGIPVDGFPGSRHPINTQANSVINAAIHPVGEGHNLYWILKTVNDSEKGENHHKGLMWVFPALNVWGSEQKPNGAHLSRQKGTHTIMWTESHTGLLS